MPPPDWSNDLGITYPLTPVNARSVKGERIGGAAVSEIQCGDFHLLYHHWQRGVYQLAYCVIQLLNKFTLFASDAQPGLRMEVVLNGELILQDPDGKKTKVVAGQYHFTDARRYSLQFKTKGECRYFVAYYPADLLAEFAIDTSLLHPAPRAIPPEMLDLLHELLQNPYIENLRSFYYQNAVRDLLFLHLHPLLPSLTSTLHDADIAAVYRAEALLSKDIAEHYSIPELARMAGTNDYKLKKGFQEIFKIGIFGRLMHHRVNHALHLLETTDKPIKEIALETGYHSTSGFIKAFRKRFGLTPQLWRERKIEERGGR